MDQTWSNLIATGIGALAGLSGATLTAGLQQRSEHKRWLREQTQLAYSNALKALSKATVIPVSTKLEEIEAWSSSLSEVRESLVVLQVYCTEGRERLIVRCKKLFAALDENDYAMLATTATTLKDTEADISGFVLLGVGSIRAEIVEVLNAVSSSARLDLRQLVVA